MQLKKIAPILAANLMVALAATAFAQVPRLIQFNGTLKDTHDKPLSGAAPMKFSIYAGQQDNQPLWTETQQVTPSADGTYSVLLGMGSEAGIPAELFAKGEARWLGIQAPEQMDIPRVLLVSVPYALKAGDAETLGGLPASVFLSAATQAAQTSAAATPAVAAGPAITPAITPTGNGATDYVPLWTSSTNLGNSILSQGMGYMNIGGGPQFPALGTATSATGYNSQPLDLLASAYNSSTDGAVSERFRWQAEPVSNDTTAASGKLDLLYGTGAAAPTETGLSINSKGVITFAPGQTFPSAATLGTNNFIGAETIVGPLSVSGGINEALRLYGNVTDIDSGWTSSNVIGGYTGNAVTNNATGATIAGGGTSGFSNTVSEDFATVSGGAHNTASGTFATVPGGATNIAAGESSLAAGKVANATDDGSLCGAS